MTSLAVGSSSIANTLASNSTTASTTSTGGSSSSATSMTQSDFMKLLTAQLQYQNPDSPDDPSTMISEFASVDTVNGIQDLGKQLTSIDKSTTAGQLSQAADLVGKKIAVGGNALVADNTGSAEGAFNLSGSASNVGVTILNPNGTVAHTMSLGSLGAGQQSFDWTGATAGQSYTYEVSAQDSTGNAVNVTPYTVYSVTGVNVGTDTPTVNVAGSSDAIDASSIQTVLGE